MSMTEKLRIVVIREGNTFVAQCLEHDICTQAPDIETLQERMACLLKIELASGQEIDAAPEKFHKMWDKAFYKPAGDHEYGLMPAAA